MRDDRYSGLRLPRYLPKLFQMSWRDADRRVPRRMLMQAIKVIRSLCKRELSPALLSALRRHQSCPTLVDGYYMQKLASKDRLGGEIAGLIEDDPGLSSRDAVRMGLLARGEYYVLEQKFCHGMDLEAVPQVVSDSVRSSLQNAAVVVTDELFSGPTIKYNKEPFSIDEILN